MHKRSGDAPKRPIALDEITGELTTSDFIAGDSDNETVITEKPISSMSMGALFGNRYQLERRLGVGATSDVWQAFDTAQRRSVALKIMRDSRDSSDDDWNGRFHREARLLSRIRHPNAIEVFDYATEPKPYLAMELLEGEDLETKLRRNERIPLRECVPILSQLCAGLACVHAAGIVHRDIKPANIYCLNNGAVKLVDFGLAKKPHHYLRPLNEMTDATTQEAPITRRGNVVGTIKYMSPEQLSRNDIDFKSDLWSAAVVLYRMLTGTLPFSGTSDLDVMIRIVREPSPAPSRDVKDLPPKIDNFFIRALQKDPANRFTSAYEMGEAFSRIVNGAATRPPPARPPRP